MLEIRTEKFDKSIIFPRGKGGSSVARARLERLAFEQILDDVRRLGYEPIPETRTLLWLNAYQGRVTVDAVKTTVDPTRGDPGRRVGFLGGGWP